MDSDDDDFGPRVPPLSVFIGGILKRYPDGSQILKELLQNAEDAEASVVRFLYDKNTYSSNQLFQQFLNECQGPALCAYNDAQFQPQDWKGIQQPQQSHKKDNVLKVGKFGIGFNSVYHVTDMPWILSGNKLAVIEPSVSMFNRGIRGGDVNIRTPGFKWIFNKRDHQNEIRNSWGQFQPIETAAQVIHPNRNGFTDKWNFDGTMIRLPLRTENTQKIPYTKPYTDGKINQLFEGFATELHDLLLFLSRLERIEVLTMHQNSNATVTYQVTISPDSITTLRIKRQQLMDEIKTAVTLREKNQELTKNVIMNMSFNIDVSNPVYSKKSWIASHYLPQRSSAPISWDLERTIKRLPWVSLAADIETTVQGRIFCFLPLPCNSESMTGLPVHVNAYFGVEDNRRSLKWSSVDRAQDVDAKWNEALLQEVIPVAYVQLIWYCIEVHGEASYKLWPQINNVHIRWKAVLKPFLALLFKYPVLKISSPGGTWSYLSANVYIDSLSQTFDERITLAVRSCLDKVKTPYAKVPKNVLDALAYYSQLFTVVINYINPVMVRNELLKIVHWNEISAEDKLLLLQYFVTSANGVHTNAAAMIKDLPIIQLADGSFGSFCSLNNLSRLYLASKNYQELLPTMRNSIINVEVLPNAVIVFLNAVERMKTFNIIAIDNTNFSTLLKNSLPNSWKSNQSVIVNLNVTLFPNMNWLQKLWIHLKETYPYSLQEFEGLNLLQYSNQVIIPLPKKSNSVLFEEGAFSYHIQEMLKNAKGTAISANLLKSHNDLRNYIYDGKVMSLLKLIENCGISSINDAMNGSSRNELITLIADNIYSITTEGKNVVQQLNLFELLRWPSNTIQKFSFVSIYYCLVNWTNVSSVTFNDLPVQVKTEPYLDCRNHKHKIIAEWLGISTTTQEEVSIKIINNAHSYSANDFSLLLLWAMDFVRPWQVMASIVNSYFIPSDDGYFHTPSQLFDPNVRELKNLFFEETGRFPSGDYNSSKTVEFLRGVGLRTTTGCVSIDELMQTARVIHKSGLKSQVKLDCFNQQLISRAHELSSQEVRELMTLKLFKAQFNRPSGYPGNLTWYGAGTQNTLFTSRCLAQKDCAMIVGSVMPVVELSLPIQLGLTVRENIPTELLVKHLVVVSNNYQSLNKLTQEVMMYESYKILSEKDSNELQKYLNSEKFNQWIWTGKEFVAPNQIVTNWNYYKTGLEPYMNSLPNFLQEENLLTFFCEMGVMSDDDVNVGKSVLKAIRDKHKIGVIGGCDSRTDFNYFRNILEVIADILLAEGEDVEIPIKHNLPGLKFRPACECKFNDCDENFIDVCEVSDTEDDIVLVHPDLPNNLCQKLGATPLSNAVLGAEEYEQHESLLNRLSGISDSYPPGATIFQELIQNADDAKATTIEFLVDMRENSNWRRSVLWREPSRMDKFQGPALWVFNDATFTDDDFKNILDVGGATKKTDSEKIGAFGVGFNCVYNLTDMPSFVSRSHLAFLDPQKQCLPRTAGIKFNLQTRPRILEVFAHQFLPYNGVFGCDLSYRNGGVHYPHTLFRLPLRNLEMANHSKLCKNSYDLLKMRELLASFVETSSYVMLFLQHVKTISLNYLDSSCSNPQNMQKVLSIHKTLTPQNGFKGQDALIRTVKTKIASKQQFTTLHYFSFMDLSTTSSQTGLSVGRANGTSQLKWLLQWTASADKAYEMACTAKGEEHGLMPVVAIAARISDEVESISGLAFCYLPLPIETGLPFHLHAAFALDSSRLYLWRENARNLSNLKIQWNEALKTESLVSCLIQLLQNLREFDKLNVFKNYKFFTLWPIQDKVLNDFHGFVTNVYNKLCNSQECLWKTVDGRWVTFSQSLFLLLSTEWTATFRDAVKRAMQWALNLHNPNCGLVEISTEVQKSLESSLFKKQFMNQSFGDEKFFTEFFFKILDSYDFESVNEILLEILSSNQAQKPYLRKLLYESKCIPTSHDGRIRLRPQDLINMKSEISKLYFEDENKFPHISFQGPDITQKLSLLGMRSTASSGMLLERATTVETLFQQGLIKEAKLRSKLILDHLVGTHIEDSAYKNFMKIPFLFPLPQPENWNLPWHISPRDILCPEELFSTFQQKAVCFVAPILDTMEVKNGPQLAYHLGCRRQPLPTLILEQLQILSKLSPETFTHQQCEMVQSIVSECFKTLQASNELMKPLFTDFASCQILLIKKAFVPYQYVCCSDTQEDYAPYLYTLKGTPYDKHGDLLMEFGVKQCFTVEDYVDALQRMKQTLGENALPQNMFKIAEHLCRKVYDCVGSANKFEGEVLVPDQNKILRPATSLAYWELSMDEIPPELLADIHWCNRQIARDIALKLGVRLQRNMMAERFYSPFQFGESFGQHEELTTRISNILDEYSSKSDVINEMIQNADDAGATEIRFILDERQLPTDSTLLSENWKYLQGASLIVYNNRPFEEKDFEGIRNLGLGSKRAEPDLTGKFGIGFNTVYHVTDVPMFISNNEKLCVLDPHKLYVPTATVEAPGGMFDLHEHFRKIYGKILLGFHPVDDLKLEGSTVFRLPLRLKGQKSIPSQIGDSIEPKELLNDLKKFTQVAEEYFFFLKNIEKIRISHVNEHGKLCYDSCYFSEISKADREKKKKFSQIMKSKDQLSEDVTVEYKMTIGSKEKEKKCNWMIFQRLSCMKDDVPSEVAKLRASGKLLAAPLVGIAMPLFTTKSPKLTYTTLPLSGESKLPVHVNGKFMLDQGRKQCYLEGDGSFKKQWNVYLITKGLAPLYIKCLENIKDYVVNQWEKTHSDKGNDTTFQINLIKKFQHFLPTTSGKKPIGSLLLKEVYHLIHENSLKLTFGIYLLPTGSYFARNLSWLSSSEGVIDTFVKKKEPQPSVRLTTGVTKMPPKEDNKPTDIDYIRQVLEIVHFPKYDLGFNSVIKEICSTVEMKENVITPLCVAEHMKKVKDELLLIPGYQLPLRLETSVLTDVGIRHCLNYILEAENVDLENIPFLLTADNLLRRFSSDYEVYPSDYSHLLPTQGNLFCNRAVFSFKIPEKYCRKFGISVLANYLKGDLPDLYGNCKRKPLCENMKLIYAILRYLASNDVYEKDADERKLLASYVKPLQDWSLLPATALDTFDRTNNFLVTLGNASLVVFPVSNLSDKTTELYRCLRKLGVIFAEVSNFFKICFDDELNFGLRDNLIKFFSNLCASLKAPETIVTVLYSVLKSEIEGANFDRIDEKERLVLLDFIVETFSHVIKDGEKCTMKMIKSLPLFQTLEGNFVTLDKNYSYIICDEKIEGAELDKLMNLREVVLLSNKFVENETFCKNLNLTVMPLIKLYEAYIIPCLPNFTMNAIIRHLHFLHRIPYSEDKDQLYKCLGATPFVQMSAGKFKAIRDLYNEDIKKEFEKMLPEDSFLPETFLAFITKDECFWSSFLKRLGLKSEISQDVFLQLARNLEAEEKVLNSKQVRERSKMLVNYLSLSYSRFVTENKHFPQSASTIKFVYAHSIPNSLIFLCNQGSELKGLICYCNSVDEMSEKICWTVCKLLPHDCLFNLPKDRMKYLLEPTVDDVVSHSENICSHLQKLKQQDTTTIKINRNKQIEFLHDVLENIFYFLKVNLNKNQQLIDRLKKVPCILVDEGRILVCPDQVVFQSDKFLECPPFLYNLPQDLYSHLELLQQIGTERIVTHHHYTSVLKMFYERFGEGEIRDPNMMKSLQIAYIGFLKKISQTESTDITEEELYLPDETSCLRKSTDIMVFTDNLKSESIADIPGKKWNTQMIKHLDQAIDKFATALLRLPTLIRPKSYTHFITTELSENCERCDGADFCKEKYDIERLFRDQMFVRVVTKIINRHSLCEKDNQAKQDELAAFFNDIRVSCYNVLKTTIKEKAAEKVIKEEVVAIFWRKVSADNSVEFLVAHEHAEMKNKFVDNLLGLVELVCPFKSVDAGLHFRSIFDKLDLYRQSDSLQEIVKRELEEGDVEDDYLPKLGSILPDDLTCLIDQNPFNYYKKFEYIAVPIKPESDQDDDPIYIYGLIIEEIGEKAYCDGLIKVFRVDIGDSKPVEKSSLDIYKFISNKTIQKEAGMALVLSDQQDETEEVDKFSRSAKEIMDEITERLERIWQNSSVEERKSLIRRLYLHWHPDKNPPERKEFCEEIFKYLKNEIYRLEAGLPRAKREEAKPSPFWNQDFGGWDNRARRDGQRRRNYNSRARDNFGCFSSGRNSGVPPTFAKSLNPAARVWCQQAKYDLDATLNAVNIAEPYYEWIFFQCYQVARKSIISMLFTKSTYENQKTNLMELCMDVLAAFGEDPGDVHNLVKFLVDKGVDEIRPLKPLFGKTNHQNYEQCGDCCKDVVNAATKLLKVATNCLKEYGSEE